MINDGDSYNGSGISEKVADADALFAKLKRQVKGRLQQQGPSSAGAARPVKN
jgi:hypothetical protein